MADIYYSYAERNASDEINWAQVGKNLTDMLSNEAKIREEKKAAIDKASREFGETLANAPQGEHRDINQWWLTYADSVQQARLMQDRLLKSGQLKPKDYFVMRQNIVDGTKQATNLIKDYQEEYKSKMERWNTKKSAKKEQWLLAEAEGFANFNNSELYINPTDFTVNVAKKEKKIVDGKEVYVMSKNPNDFTTVNAMRNRIKGTFDRFNVIDNLKPGVAALGKDVQSLVEQASNTEHGGLIKSINDIMQRKDIGEGMKEAVSLYERAENNYIKSLMVNPDDAASVLTDYVVSDPKTKEQYIPTWNEKEAGGHFILQKNDSSGRPISVLNKEQEKVVEDALRAQFRIMIDKEIELKPTAQAQLQERRPMTPTEYERQDIKSDARNLAQNISNVLTGNDDQVKAALAYFGGLGVPMKREGTGISVKTKQGAVPYTFGKNNADDLAKAIISSVNMKNLPEDMVLGFSKQFNRGKGVNTNAEGESIVGTPAQAEIQTIAPKITNTLFTSGSGASSTNLKSILPKGFTIRDRGGMFGNKVTILAPNLKPYEYDAGMKSTDDIESAKQGLIDFIEANNVSPQPQNNTNFRLNNPSVLQGGSIR